MSHIWMRHVTRVWMSFVTHMSESCHTCKYLSGAITTSHVSESCHTYEWVMSQVWMSCTTHMSESCHTCEYLSGAMTLPNATHMSESCHIYGWVTHIKSHILKLYNCYESATWSQRSCVCATPQLVRSNMYIWIISTNHFLCIYEWLM